MPETKGKFETVAHLFISYLLFLVHGSSSRSHFAKLLSTFLLIPVCAKENRITIIKLFENAQRVKQKYLLRRKKTFIK